MKKILYLLLLLPLFAACSSDDKTPSEQEIVKQKIIAQNALLEGTWEYVTPYDQEHRNREQFVVHEKDPESGYRYFYVWNDTLNSYTKTDAGIYNLYSRDGESFWFKLNENVYNNPDGIVGGRMDMISLTEDQLIICVANGTTNPYYTLKRVVE